MDGRFTVSHCNSPLESVIFGSEGEIIFRVEAIGEKPFRIKKTYYDWFSQEYFIDDKSKLYSSLRETEEDIQKIASAYLVKKGTLTKKRSNDTQGFWVREINELQRVYLRIYALPSEERFSLHKLTLIGKSMVDFDESNPVLLGYASTTEEADQMLKREIDKAYLNL